MPTSQFSQNEHYFIFYLNKNIETELPVSFYSAPTRAPNSTNPGTSTNNYKCKMVQLTCSNIMSKKVLTIGDTYRKVNPHTPPPNRAGPETEPIPSLGTNTPTLSRTVKPTEPKTYSVQTPETNKPENLQEPNGTPVPEPIRTAEPETTTAPSPETNSMTNPQNELITSTTAETCISACTDVDSNTQTNLTHRTQAFVH